MKGAHPQMPAQVRSNVGEWEVSQTSDEHLHQEAGSLVALAWYEAFVRRPIVSRVCIGLKNCMVRVEGMSQQSLLIQIRNALTEMLKSPPTNVKVIKRNPQWKTVHD
jgi:hypothetical protein